VPDKLFEVVGAGMLEEGAFDILSDKQNLSEEGRYLEPITKMPGAQFGDVLNPYNPFEDLADCGLASTARTMDDKYAVGRIDPQQQQAEIALQQQYVVIVKLLLEQFLDEPRATCLRLQFDRYLIPGTEIRGELAEFDFKIGTDLQHGFRQMYVMAVYGRLEEDDLLNASH
jgi:hypothetical protein